MRITQARLKQIIREELEKVMEDVLPTVSGIDPEDKEEKDAPVDLAAKTGS
jgi:hypothetical protein